MRFTSGLHLHNWVCVTTCLNMCMHLHMHTHVHAEENTEESSKSHRDDLLSSYTYFVQSLIPCSLDNNCPYTSPHRAAGAALKDLTGADWPCVWPLVGFLGQKYR